MFSGDSPTSQAVASPAGAGPIAPAASPVATAAPAPAPAPAPAAVPASPPALLEAESLRVQFGALVAVHDVSVSLQPGHLLGLIGPNGAGKTTFLRAVAG